MANPTKVTFIYQNLITDQGLLEVTSEQGTFEKRFLIDAQYSTTWRSANTAEQTIEMDFTQIVTASCLAIGNHNLYSEVTSIKLFHSTDGVSWTEEANLLSRLTETNFVYFFNAPVSRRYWKLVFSGASNNTFYEIGELWLAQYMELANNPQLPVSNWEDQHFVHEKDTSGGQEHSYRLYERVYWTLGFSAYNQETNQTKLRALWAYSGKENPFWCWLNPTDIDTLKFVKIDSFQFDLSVGSSYPGSMSLKGSL
jgi:hypothetical protein